MHFAFTEEQLMIGTAVREIVRRAGTVVRAHQAPDERSDRGLWSEMAAAGYTGILVPEEQGGAGLGLVEAGCVLQHLGEGLASMPYLGAAVLTVKLIERLAPAHALRQFLGAVASGQLVACPLLPAAEPRAFVVGGSGRKTISGSYGPVPHAPDAGVYIVHALEQASGTEQFFFLPGGAIGIEWQAIPSLDWSRPVYAVQLREVACSDAVHIATVDRRLPRYLHATAAAGLAAEMLGGAARVHRLACDYAKQREQFGQPIGRFQAIKHLLADGQVLLDGLESILYAALWKLEHEEEAAVAAASAAKAVASDVYGRLAGDAIQVYGAMGFAAETDPHLYLKRSQVDRCLYGTSGEHLRLWFDDYCSREIGAALPA